MKFLAAALLLATAPLSSFAAEAPAFAWMSHGTGAKNGKTRAICFDREGNVFLAGEMTGDASFGELQVKSKGAMDFVLVKVDKDGHFQWARNLGGSLVDRAYGVVADKVGNAYVTGHYQSTDAMVEGKALPNAGDYDIFVAKYSPKGDLLWVRTAGGKGYDYGHGIALDSHGDVIVTGAVLGESKFGEITVPGAGRPIFCAKYDANGTLKWVKASEGKDSSSGHGVALDGSDNIYLGGSTSGAGTFGGLPLSTAKGQSTLLIKLDSDGKAQWVRTCAGAGAHELTVDSSGRAWIAGMFKGEATVGDTVYHTTGDKDNDGLLAHYSASGDLQWSRVIQGPAVDYCLGVATDNKGTIFVTGEFSATSTFAGQTLVSKGATDIYVAALDSKGALQWLVQAGGPKGDNAYTMVWHPERGLVFGGSCTLPGTFGSKTYEGDAGGTNMYGARLELK
ncbi:SBBP repeat-containing protein [Roseimicrobium sp. ORNL1]|uniref:SBBP repeat-containing protein n=1 Tax=Roseimicrobium sp. ORNL1 TaxID=2711231 RepID=UPI00198124AE|nr:SBBP repeat-containing protein [Roseimicrobium sp. ORNL1]